MELNQQSPEVAANDGTAGVTFVQKTVANILLTGGMRLAFEVPGRDFLDEAERAMDEGLWRVQEPNGGPEHLIVMGEVVMVSVGTANVPVGPDGKPVAAPVAGI